jgi:hypothetical protein
MDIVLPLTNEAAITLQKTGNAPLSALWVVTLVTTGRRIDLGMATIRELQQLVNIISPQSLPLLPAGGKEPKHPCVMSFYDSFGPKTALYLVPVEHEMELAWAARDGEFQKSGIVPDQNLVKEWASLMDVAVKEDGWWARLARTKP